MKLVRDVPRDLLIMTFGMIVANLATFMYMPFLPLYLKSLGADVQQVGLFFTLEVILSIFFRILGGWISDNMGRLQTIAVGSLFGMGAILAFTLAPTWQWVLSGALLIAIGSSLVAPSFQAFTAESAPEGGTGSTFGLVNGLFLICQILGPILGGFLVEAYDYKTMFRVATGIFFVATIIRVSMARGRSFKLESLQVDNLKSELRTITVLLLGGGLITWLFLIDGLFDGAMQLVIPFIPLYITEVGKMGESVYGLLFAWMSFVAALAMMPGGMFSDRYGEHRGIAMGGVFIGSAWLFIIVSPSAVAFIVGFSLAGIGSAFMNPAFSAILSKAVPRKSLGITWGIFMTALGILAIPAPIIGGYFYKHVDPAMPFALTAVLMLIAIPLSLTKLHLPAPESADDEEQHPESPLISAEPVGTD